VSRDDSGSRLRAAAARVDSAVVAGGRSLDRALETTELAQPRDAALLRAICYAALRWHHRLQWQIARLLDRPLKRRDAELAALLRVGLVQIEHLRIPDHAAVDATVAAAELLGLARAKGLVNAVLRRYLREHEALAREMGSNREAVASHPAWMLDLFEREWPTCSEQIIAANNQAPPMWLRVNQTRVDPAAYLQRLGADGIAAQASGEDPAALKLETPASITALPGFVEGLVSVQDAAAQRAARHLAPAPGERILDACAAPGGKAAHVLELCPQVAELVALDSDPDRLRRVEENFSRLGLPGRVAVGDASRPSQWWDGRPFDRILLDAPCSALGVIRRHPDIKVLRRPSDIEALAARQAGMLRALWPLLAPGGRLVYATCTLTHAENQDQVRAFLEQVGEACLLEPETEQIIPGEANRDGFYYACFEKR